MINVFLSAESNYNNSFRYLISKYKDSFYDSVIQNHKFDIFTFDDDNKLINERNEQISDLMVNIIFNNSDSNNITIYCCDKQNGLIKQICNNIKLSILESQVIPRQIDIVVSNEENHNYNKNISSIIIEFNIEESNTNWLFNDIILKTLSNKIVNSINKFSDIVIKNSLFNIDTHTTAKELFSNNILDNIIKIVPLIKKYQQGTGLLTSVSVSQFILETGYGCSDCLKNSNNCFGLKSFISNNNWYGSCWNKETYYTNTTEQHNGEAINIIGVFRKYSDIESSIVDHCSYLLNAKRGKIYRYKNINTCNNYIEACNLLNVGGYSTSIDYGKKLIEIIEKYDLTKFDN